MDKIGIRAAREIVNRQDSDHALSDILDEIQINRQRLWYYQKDKADPSAYTLRAMALAGYDIYYILTGERKDERKIYKGGYTNEQSRRTV